MSVIKPTLSSATNVKGIKLALAIMIILDIGLGVLFSIVSIKEFAIAFIPLLAVLAICISLFLSITNYIAFNDYIVLHGHRIFWYDVKSVKMLFQNRRLITLVYMDDGRKRYAVILASSTKGDDTFIPKEFSGKYHSEIELFIRSKIGK